MARKPVKGHHCFVTKDQVTQIGGNPNHILWLGEFNGPFVNLEGDGSFMHGSAWRCPGMQEIVDGKTVDARGYCMVKHPDGESEAVLRWEATPSTMPGELKGRSWWVGEGTGKFKGVKGENNWEIAYAVQPNAAAGEQGAIGFSNFDGWYELPEG